MPIKIFYFFVLTTHHSLLIIAYNHVARHLILPNHSGI